MTYCIQNHGDMLEREASQLIKTRFPNYEIVWQTYIGNNGSNKMAEMPNYPNETKRKNFAENSYTVLESVFIIDHILNSDIFEIELTDFKNYIEFNKAFITIFALLGRMHDTVIKASDALKYDNRKFKKSIHKFYEARSIVIHGKKVPLSYDNIGLPRIPFLKTSNMPGDAWEDNHTLWKEANNMKTTYVIDKLTEFFNEMLLKINDEYAVFYHYIMEELKSISTSLEFIYFPITNELIPDASGSTSLNTEPIDVYGFYKKGK